MTPQQKYYQAHKDEPYFKLCQAVARAKSRNKHRAKYNAYMRGYMKSKKGIGKISTETGQDGRFIC